MRRFKLVDIVILISLIFTTLYVVSNNIPLGMGSYIWLWRQLSIIVIILSTFGIFKKKPLAYTVIYGLIIVGLLQYTLWSYMEDLYRGRILEDFINIFTFVLIWTYYRSKNKFIILSKISRILFMCIIITIITTNIALTIDPLIVRNSANGFAGSQSQLALARLYGSAGYGYTQAMVIFIPVLAFHIKKNKRLLFSKSRLILVLTLIIITILRAQVFANILAMLVILLLSFSSSNKQKSFLRYIGLFMVIFYIIPNSFYIDVLRTSSEYFPRESNTHYKLNDFALFIENPEFNTSTGAGGRAERYPMLIEAFLAQPILGDASYESNIDTYGGGHLYFMKKLADWGLLGFAFFIYMLYQIYRSISRKILDNEMNFYYFLSVLALVILGLMKNIAGREPWLFLIIIIPGLYLGTLEEMKEEQERLIIKENNNV